MDNRSSMDNRGMVSRSSMDNRGSMVSRGRMDNRGSMVSRSMDSMHSMGNWSMDSMHSMGNWSMNGMSSNRDNSSMPNSNRLVSTNSRLDLRKTLGVVYLRDGGVGSSKSLGLDNTSLLSIRPGH